jgi:hypothetical protein
MPRYHFSIRINGEFLRETPTMELEDDNEARATSEQLIRSLAARFNTDSRLDSAIMIVADAWDMIVCEVPFAGATQPAPHEEGSLH